MKLKLILFAALIILLISSDEAKSQWVSKPSIPFSNAIRDGSVSWVIGDKCYLVAGNGHSDLLEYDPVLGSWRQLPSIPQGVTGFAMGFVINGKGYICGGNSSMNYHSSVWQYNPVDSSWLQKFDMPFGKRANGVGFSIDGYGYIACGDDSSFIYSDLYRYNPALDHWDLKAPFLGGYREWPYGFSGEGKGFIGGGAQTTELNDLWEYDPIANGWTQKSSLPGAPRQCAVSFSSNDYGFVGLGQASFTTTFDDVYKYEIANDQWTPLPSFTPGGRAWPAGFAANNQIFITTGWNFTTFYKDIYALDVITGIELPENRNEFIINSLPGKNVFLSSQSDSYRNIIVTLFDLSGKEVFLQKFDFINSHTIELNGISSGLYIIKIDSGDHFENYKVVIRN